MSSRYCEVDLLLNTAVGTFWKYAARVGTCARHLHLGS